MSESRIDNLKSENSRLRDEIEKRNTSIANLAGCPTEVAVFLVALVIAGATVAGLLEPGGLQSGLLVGVLCGAFVAMLACLAVPVVAAFGWFGRRVSSPTRDGSMEAGQLSDEQEKGLPQATSPTSDGPSGINGWLLLPAVGLVMSPILMAVVILLEVALLKDFGFDWAVVTEGMLYVVFLVFMVFTGVAFFRKRPVVPRLMVAWLSLNVLLSLLGAVIGRDAVPATEALGEIVRSVVAAAVWIPYFLVSKRVKNTFVLRGSEATIALVSFDNQIKSYRDWLDFDIIQRERMEAQLTADQRARLRQLKSAA